MRTRPTSITVIGWFFVLTAICSLWSDLRYTMRSQERTNLVTAVPRPVQQGVSWSGTAMNMVCGYFLLKGKNWARYTQIVWSLAMFAYGYFISPLPWMLAIGLAIEGVMVYLLFRPAANAFFAAENAGLPIANEMSKRQIASTLFYVLGGFWLTGALVVSLLTPQPTPPYLWLVAVSLLVFPGMLILIGKLLSPNPNWIREIGIVLLVSAAGGVVFQLALALFFSSAGFQKAFMAGRPVPELNVATGATAILAIAWCGGLLVWVGRPRNAVNPTKRVR